MMTNNTIDMVVNFDVSGAVDSKFEVGFYVRRNFRLFRKNVTHYDRYDQSNFQKLF